MRYAARPVPTVTIQGPNGSPLIINKSDFDEEKHKLFVSEEAEEGVDKPDDQVDGTDKKDKSEKSSLSVRRRISKK